MNLVGRSRVSAITQTPASGPLALVTTPPKSPAPTVTAGTPCWAIDVAVSIIVLTRKARYRVESLFMMRFLPRKSVVP